MEIKKYSEIDDNKPLYLLVKIEDGIRHFRRAIGDKERRRAYGEYLNGN